MQNLRLSNLLKKVIFVFMGVLLTPFCSIYAQSPGGVTTDLTYWLKADVGTTLFFDAANDVMRVSDWSNQAIGFNNSISQITDTSSPVYTINALNFNPGLSFDGQDDFMSATAGYDSPTQIIIFNPTQPVTGSLPLELIVTYEIFPNAVANAGMGIGNSFSPLCTDNYFFFSRDNDITAPEYLACFEDASFCSRDPFIAVARQNEQLPYRNIDCGEKRLP